MRRTFAERSTTWGRKSRGNGLIGDPLTDNRYTYGHGFSMLFLSQVLGEEEDVERRQELMDILERAVDFSGKAQTDSGGWGYVSAKDGNNFDEGSTTITQVQGLRGCRNAGIPVPAEVIENAKQYIYRCKNPDGGISYSSRNRGSSRPAITAAALAALYNAGDYDSQHVPEMLAYAKQNLHNITNRRSPLDTGTTRTCTTLKSSTAKGRTSGARFGTGCATRSSANSRPAAVGRATSGRSTSPPAI